MLDQTIRYIHDCTRKHFLRKMAYCRILTHPQFLHALYIHGLACYLVTDHSVYVGSMWVGIRILHRQHVYLAWAWRLFVCLSVCLSVCLFSKRVSGSTYTVENSYIAALVPSSPEMKPALAVVGSATVAVLSQPCSIEWPLFAIRRGHVVYNNCVLLHVVQTTVPWLLLL